MAIKGNQFEPSVGEIDPLDVKEFSELPEGKSFISTDYAEKLVSGDYDVKGPQTSPGSRATEAS